MGNLRNTIPPPKRNTRPLFFIKGLLRKPPPPPRNTQPLLRDYSGGGIGGRGPPWDSHDV